ncbi:hypothetical protein CDAR_176241 [Caerostris darwini]|uniref:Uncharacterized protein n=1 Tax=Caerostris darwini TaxID=1538125 RepID=A0AAV4NXH5_9ARAC|nr:hypothetical protein CDAR_176241 [Caerostris darwini]
MIRFVANPLEKCESWQTELFDSGDDPRMRWSRGSPMSIFSTLVSSPASSGSVFDEEGTGSCRSSPEHVLIHRHGEPLANDFPASP